MANLTDRICIIGGGPAGISAAMYLQKKGYKEYEVYEKLNKVGGQKVFSNILNSLLSKFSAGSSEGEGSGVGGFLTGMLGGSLDDVSDDDWAKWAEEYRNSPEYQEEMARKAAMEAYVLKEFADGLEAGDAQVVCLGAGIDDVQEDGSWKYLRNFSLTNYTADGKNLKMKNYANNVELLYVTKQEDGSYQVEVVMQAEEGEKYEASIVAMAEKYGEELDTVKINLGRKESAEVYNLANYLREHPEYEKGEFQGEYKTPDELDEIFLDLLGQELADVDFSF